ncbi:MAG TPA: WG repeat-containing protein, partial [Chitinophagaceae bacterium]|nr:WG repeat-containing protein [Chitinophagaceae bacterium]
DFSNGLAAVGIFGQYGFIDKTGKLILPAIYDDARQFVNGFASVKIDGKWGFINSKGRIIIEPKYDDVKSFSENKVGIKINDKWGFINVLGKEIVPPKYGDVEFFSEGMAAVNFASFGFRWTFIDTTGKEIIDGPFRAVSEYKNGKANVVDFNWREYNIDMKGNEIKSSKNSQAENSFTVFAKTTNNSASSNSSANSNRQVTNSFSVKLNAECNISRYTNTPVPYKLREKVLFEVKPTKIVAYLPYHITECKILSSKYTSEGYFEYIFDDHYSFKGVAFQNNLNTVVFVRHNGELEIYCNVQ